VLLHVHRQGRASKKQLQVTVRNAEFLRFTSPRTNKEYSFRCIRRCQGTSFYSALPLTCNRLRDTIPCNIPPCLPLHLTLSPGGGESSRYWPDCWLVDWRYQVSFTTESRNLSSVGRIWSPFNVLFNRYKRLSSRR